MSNATTSIETILGLTATVTIRQTPIGQYKEADIVCDPSKVAFIISESSRRGIAHERTATGVKVFID